ncbi:MAG: aspartate--ammonia ligase [Finegoldia sp.]|nr:aspartate--ammonia ligase [Finegoldia sp.]
MSKIYVPQGYKSDSDIYTTQRLIKEIKDYFQINLSNNLNLKRVSAPLFVTENSGFNDNLSGDEKPVDFELCIEGNPRMEIVHSLAKWKRFALKRYGFKMHEGLYADMNAIRRCEDPDNTHSFYVDQWDWEKIIDESDRNLNYLKETVVIIYNTLKSLDEYLCHLIPEREKLLPDKIEFISSQELLDMYPDKTAEEREKLIVGKDRAVFVMQIGKKLSNGTKHDLRAPDYDDWELNGDILVYNPVLDSSLELTSMAIRVDPDTMLKQLKEADNVDRLEFQYHKSLMNNELPLTIGGGIGQSRLCMFFLQKAHIGEVQVSYWPREMRKELEAKGVYLL